MLKIMSKLSQLNFSELMNVYKETNFENGKEQYPCDSMEEQLRNAEADFYDYLCTVFFQQIDSFYAVWDEAGSYKAALRLEPYQDGYLLCALETAPDERNKGYATLLIINLQNQLHLRGRGTIYSHVSKRNLSSIAVHKKSGFQIIKDYAVYLDGSVSQTCYTFSYKY